jgi:hypothetical protein
MKVMKSVRSSSFQQLLARRTNVGVSITVNMRTIYGIAVFSSNVAESVHGAAQPGLFMNPSTVNTDTLLRRVMLSVQSVNVLQSETKGSDHFVFFSP